MLRGRRFPAWLTRRGYFKRVARWAKPYRRLAPADTASPEPEAASSDVPGANVLPFPERPGDARETAFAARRAAGTG